MAYHQLLVLKDSSSTEEKLVFKDFSEEKLRAAFVTPFLESERNRRGPDDFQRHTLRLRIIRTVRPHDVEVDDYLRDWWRKADEFMRVSGQPINFVQGDSAIAGAGDDVTQEILLGRYS